MLVRIRIKRRSTGTIIEYLLQIDRKKVMEKGCQVCRDDKKRELEDQFCKSLWNVEVRHIADCEVTYEEKQDIAEFRLALRKCGVFLAGSAI